MLTRFVRIQLAIFGTVGLIGMVAMLNNYIQVQSLLGIGRITVEVDLPESGGLYQFSNVTYRGVQIGRVTAVDLVHDGTKRHVRATISLDPSARIPVDVVANVRSVSAVGEQYIDFVPRGASGPFLHDGSVVALADTTVPQPVGPMMDKASAFLGSIPKDRLHQVTDELYKSFNGADYDLQSLFDSASTLASSAHDVSGQAKTLVEHTAPLLDTQAQTLDDISTWVRSLAHVSDQLVSNDPQIRTILQKAPDAIDESSRLLNQLNPTLPVLLANMTTLGQIAVTYHPGLEQILVLLPPAVSIVQAVNPNRNASGIGLGTFRMTISDPPNCTVGFLPPSSWRPPFDTTTIDTPNGLYCKLPQDSPISVRGVRNIPCMNKPGKRAPTVDICDSDQDYEPLAQKQPVLGPYPRDPNLEAQGIPPDSRWFPDQGLYAAPGQGATAPDKVSPTPPTTGLVPPPAGGVDAPAPPPDMPQPMPPDTPTVPPPSDTPPIPSMAPLPTTTNAPAAVRNDHTPAPGAVYARYDPRSGEYLASDSHLYRQANLAAASGVSTWKDLVLNGSA